MAKLEKEQLSTGVNTSLGKADTASQPGHTHAVSEVTDSTPTGTVNGSNVTFTLAVSASQAVVYADGLRVKGGGVDYTHSGSTITFVSGSQPYSAISVDYLPS